MRAPVQGLDFLAEGWLFYSNLFLESTQGESVGVLINGRREEARDPLRIHRAQLGGLALLVVMAVYGWMGPEAGPVHAQPSPPVVHPLHHTFPAGAYDGSPKLWAVTQDDRGLLYIGGQRYLRHGRIELREAASNA